MKKAMKKLTSVFLLLVMLSTTMLTSCSKLSDLIGKFSGTLDLDVSAGNTTINNTINNNYGNNETDKSENDDEVGKEDIKNENEILGKFNEINTENSYIGYGIDIINSSAVTNNNVLVTYPIFDIDKLMGENLLKSNGNYSLFETIESDTIKGFTENMSNSSSITTGVNVAAEGKVFGVTAKASASFSEGLATRFTKTSDSVESQYFLEVIADNQSYWLALQSTEARYKEILSAEFKADLYNTSITPEALFKKYGTHLLTGVVMGGNICMYYTLYSYDSNTSLEDYAEISSLIKSNVEASYGKKASVGTDVEKSYSDAYTYINKATAKSVRVDSKIICAGGSNFGIINEQTLYDNYYEWQKSLDQNPVVIGVKDSNSLYPIWKLLDMSIDGAEERYNELYNYFKEYGTASFDKLCESYEIKATYTVDFNTGIHDVEIPSLYGIKKNTNIVEYKPEITRDGYLLEGWYKDVNHTEKFNFETDTVVSDMTLYARWKPILVTNVSIEFSTSNGNRDKYVTDDDGVFDLVSPNLDVASLIGSGYTKISVEIVFDWKAYDLGTHRLWVSKDKSRSNAFHTFSYETGTFWGSESNWYSKTTTFSVDLSELNDDGSFYLEWGAEGDGSDNWSLGHTVVKITVL